ncbi:MAG: MGMT family protein [Sphingobacteriales bacterium]|nr:MGMT family protein [Sphingobacteriales bacterium]
MATKKKTWLEKLNDSKDLPKVVKLNAQQSRKWGKGTMAIPSPLEVNSIMKKVPSGKLITINRIREKIARKHHATIGCPITTGIFSWIAANAAVEAEAMGKKKMTPYWRTLKQGGVINEKYPGGIEKQAELLEQEGHYIVQKGKHWMVKDWEKRLMK